MTAKLYAVKTSNRQRAYYAPAVMRVFLLTLAGLVWCANDSAAQAARPVAIDQNAPADAAADAWSFEASAFTYIVPDAGNYLQPTLAADRGWLHLEGRFNYEAIDTGSVWIGWNFGAGDRFTWALTPMFGAVLGDTNGIAPGYHGLFGWRKLEFYSEGEYVVDAEDRTGNFFYNWSEFTIAPVESFWFGIVTQRTRAYQTEREIQRGLLAGFSYGRVDVVGHVFNPDDEAPTIVVAVRVGF